MSSARSYTLLHAKQAVNTTLAKMKIIYCSSVIEQKRCFFEITKGYRLHCWYHLKTNAVGLASVKVVANVVASVVEARVEAVKGVSRDVVLGSDSVATSVLRSDSVEPLAARVVAGDLVGSLGSGNGVLGGSAGRGGRARGSGSGRSSGNSLGSSGRGRGGGRRALVGSSSLLLLTEAALGFGLGSLDAVDFVGKETRVAVQTVVVVLKLFNLNASAGSELLAGFTVGSCKH